ncbi:mannose-6-phosphate isomerase type 1 [Salinibacterium amurskyense]|uniref:mannose-6-phosphate isomerase n=1 Tax=Salinibacterium amurskyense TaxID=205941 RepID=A0A2M9D817_9MICO|nr:mannose-6-phosphate isomerase, class I [Salinibacterium amurskyense]PJJ81812.1 mannose-6-phosphate isomerase type 1 [Salinibacterium amurskyense]RLQ81612.1 mannose-6-phosphate isomerase, class I [Salinibacterium amurskyense]GHD79219.1 putative mannose-6-phosphate isomerase ManA [Salinibacterium amurskyense]
MFVGITNTPRDYAWGSAGEISTLLGTPPTGKPEAELWLGAHPGSPSVILDPSGTAGASDLHEWIQRDSEQVLGAGVDRLPFLLKVLAAGAPLSLQAHPTPEQAAAGFARENAAGVPLTASNRNYKDASAKPELILAVSDTFEALCGFRAMAQTRASIEQLAELDAASSTPTPALFAEWLAFARADSDLRAMFEWLISAAQPVPELVERVTALAEADSASEEFALVRTLAGYYAGDPGVLISLMLNHVTLAKGEALFLPAGNIHAYLRGLGIELMASSDNVMRGGLTPKHVDVPELLSVLDFSASPVPYLSAEPLNESTRAFRPPVRDFQLVEVHEAANVELRSAAIVLCTVGEFTVQNGERSATLSRGESIFVTSDEGALSIRGAGQLFVAATQ